MPTWVNKSPTYTTYPIPEFSGNPLIEALTPPPDDRDDAILRLSEFPNFSEDERNLPAVMRMFLPARLSRFLFPTTQYVRFLNHLSIQVFDGYSTRNPMTASGQQYLHHAATRPSFVPVIDPGTGRLSTISMVCGIPGIGKSTLIRGCMSMLGKPVIRHSNYDGQAFPETQILYLMRNVPDQCSAKAFCKTYGDYTDALLGMPLYAKFFADKSMTRTHYVAQLRRIIVTHHVGALILDCIENLLLGSPSEVKEFIALLINIRDELRVPVILVGTHKAADILKADMSTARRIVEGGFHELNRPTTPEDPDFSSLCEVIWSYQWVKKPLEYEESLRDVLYDYSQGITGIMITLFIASQIEAIDSGKETVSKDLIKTVYNERFKPLHRIVNALRSNNKSLLDQYDDLYLKAFEELKADPMISRVEEIKAQLAANKERTLGIMDGTACQDETKKNAASLLSMISEESRQLPQALLCPLWRDQYCDVMWCTAFTPAMGCSDLCGETSIVTLMMNKRPQLPFFPVPAIGETVFSVVSRCSERLGIANRYLMQLLTGQDYTRTLFSALPGYLGDIAGVLPAGHPWHDTKALINAHTALPYFTYFHRKALREESARMLANASNAQPIALGLGLSTYRTPAFLKNPRFCVSCLQEQAIEPGFAYFHLAHQLPGVTHCWQHGEVLSDGCITCGPYPIKGKKLTMPGQCLCESFAASAIECQEAGSEAALWLARESAYLLTSSNSQDGRLDKLREGVIQAGLCRGSLVDYSLLATAIESRFGKDFLNRINHPVQDETGRPSAWIRRCFRNQASSKRLPCIVGLLVLGTAFDSVKAFEEGRASCTHPERIDTPSAALEISATPQPATWKTNLKQVLAEHQYRISACAAALHQTSWSVALEAREQKITIPLSARATERIGKDPLKKIREQLQQGIEKKRILQTHQISEWTLKLIELDAPELAHGHRRASANRRQEKHRASVTKFMHANPTATRQTILDKLPGTYDFLISQDKAWFHENVPKATHRKVSARTERNDWQKIDAALADAIHASGSQMLIGDGRPQRITTSVLLNKHRALQKFTAQPSRFPLTSKALEEFTETPEQYLERKVRWGIRRLIDSEREISMDTLRRETAIPDTKLKKHLTTVRRILSELGAVVSEKSALYG